jgi:hypothetical protein
VSLSTRFVARLEKATSRPSALVAGSNDPPSACPPLELTLTRLVCLVRRSCTKMSTAPFVSPATRFVAALAKAT